MSRFRTGAKAVLFLVIFLSGCGDDSTSTPVQGFSQQLEESFTVGDLSVLKVSNFAGSVIVRQGSAGVINVVATKRAAREEDLDQLDVQMVALQNGVEVSATNSLQLNQVSVDFEITAPPDVQPLIQIAAGSIDYEGSGIGQSSLMAAAGSVTVSLPVDVNVEVLLTVGAGTISIGFPVVGLVEDQRIDGIIGTGVDGRIEASVGAGEIVVIPQ
jgi:hypothetical protein